MKGTERHICQSATTLPLLAEEKYVHQSRALQTMSLSYILDVTQQ